MNSALQVGTIIGCLLLVSGALFIAFAWWLGGRD